MEGVQEGYGNRWCSRYEESSGGGTGPIQAGFAGLWFSKLMVPGEPRPELRLR